MDTLYWKQALGEYRRTGAERSATPVGSLTVLEFTSILSRANELREAEAARGHQVFSASA